MEEACRKILSRLEKGCSRREYCSSDILRKAKETLGRECLPEAWASDILESLIADGFVDDLRYASAFCREKSSITGWGPVKMRFALAAKGIQRDVIESALSEIDTDKAEQRLAKLIAAKRKSLDGDPQAKLKLIKFALSRGYGYDLVRRFVDGRND